MKQKSRKTRIQRKTSETNILLNLNVDGGGKSCIRSGIPFLDHMLTLFSKHGLFDITLKATGDLDVDIHHTNEDIGIVFGQAFAKALADKRGIQRYGFCSLPMDEALVRVSLDLSGRPSLAITRAKGVRFANPRDYSFHDASEFMKAFSQHAGINMHIEILAGQDSHHVIEAMFKAVSRAMDMATRIDPRVRGIPSTKGSL
ncbi:MAG: imidazoleglycerol-phosphate dehydratase HisB [Candidatus Omnitrophica bacterium]|nr:imidazoleglycerol-phosphate dehydratase HisB [Candidatus Omnitrophota bacterium]